MTEIPTARGQRTEGLALLETIAISLSILWLLGEVSGYTPGNFVYILPATVLVLPTVRFVGGRTAGYPAFSARLP